MAALKGIDASIRLLATVNHSAFLKQALIVTHKRAAELLGISPATQSEYCTEHAERFCQHLAAMGLEVVKKGGPGLPADQARAVLTLAVAHMERLAIEQAASDTSPGELGGPER